MAKDRGPDEEEEEDEEGGEELMEDFSTAADQLCPTEVVLVVKGRRIRVDRSRLALVSKFFRALFSHQFEDSNKSVLHLDNGGEMGLTVTAVEILAEFAKTRHLSVTPMTAVQLFVAADALDVESARLEAETFLGTNMLKPEKETFLNFWKMSRLFHMKILDSFLDCLCLDNFGWFTTTLPLLCPQYLASWPLDKLGNFLAQQRFTNCSEEQIFLAVVSYCRTKSGQHSWDELAPGLYRSCGSYLRYIQSVPRMLPCKTRSS